MVSLGYASLMYKLLNQMLIILFVITCTLVEVKDGASKVFMTQLDLVLSKVCGRKQVSLDHEVIQ